VNISHVVFCLVPVCVAADHVIGEGELVFVPLLAYERWKDILPSLAATFSFCRITSRLE